MPNISSPFRPLGPPIGADDPGGRLDAYLALKYPFLSRASWKRRVKDGRLRVSGRQVRAGYQVRAGDCFELYSPVEAEPEVDKRIYPLWRQGSVMAVYKPGCLPMHENGPYRTHTFAHILRQEFGPGWAALHRLDRETSGIVLCSDDASIRKALSEAFIHGEIQKEYLLICKGVPQDQEFWEYGPIGDLQPSRIRIKKWVVENGQSAATRFAVLAQTKTHSLLRAFPQTGRTNQIRIHAAVNGLPLVGDKLYHPDEGVFEEFFAQRGNTPRVVAATGFERHCLHATRLRFRHPLSGAICDITSEMPEDMQQLWQRLKL